MKTLKEKSLNVLETIFWVLDGKFGTKVLKPKYRLIWRCIIWGFILTIVIGTTAEIMSKITDVINYIIWGIK